MEQSAFEAMVQQLEVEAKANPSWYKLRVAAIALFGFVILGVGLGFSVLVLGSLAGLVLLTLKVGGGWLILLAAKLGKFLLLLLVPVWVMVKSTWQMLTSRFPKPEGHEVRRRDAPELFSRLDELRHRMKGPRFHKILVTNEVNAAVVQHPRLGVLGWHVNYLILGLPLMQVMTEDEIMAVIAHEYGHLSGQHGRFGAFIYRLRNAWARMQEISDSWDDAGSQVVARLFNWYAPRFNAFTFVMARKNEYEADLAAAGLVGVQAASNALVRVNIAAHFSSRQFWADVDRQACHYAEPVTRSQFWAKSWQERLSEENETEYLSRALAEKTGHADTHPCLTDRILAMGGSIKSLRPPPRAEQTAAEALLGKCLPGLQAAMDAEWRDQVKEQWSERHQYFCKQLQRLQELRGMSEPDEGEAWEIICLTEECEGEAGIAPLLASFLERAPDHAAALFMRGRRSLAAGDEAGIADLESAMERDAEATLPACQLLYNYLSERDKARAALYEERWLKRREFESERRHEIDTLNMKEIRLLPSGLPRETEVQCAEEILRCVPEVRKLWLLRRVINIDPKANAYVIGYLTHDKDYGEALRQYSEKIAGLKLPVSAHIVPLAEKHFEFVRRRIDELGEPPIIDEGRPATIDGLAAAGTA